MGNAPRHADQDQDQEQEQEAMGMRQTTIGGYQGPVELLTLEDELVAQAACRYRAEADASGTDAWAGTLHRMEPADAVVAGRYRLRFPTGQQADITVLERPSGSTFTPFTGLGGRPLLGAGAVFVGRGSP